MGSGEQEEQQQGAAQTAADQHHSKSIKKPVNAENSQIEIDPASTCDRDQPESFVPAGKDACREESEYIVDKGLCLNEDNQVQPTSLWTEEDHNEAAINRTNRESTTSVLKQPPSLKHHLFREPRPPRKSKSKNGAGKSSTSSPPSKSPLYSDTRKRKANEIDLELRDSLMEGPESCVLEGSIAQAVLERIGELDGVQVRSHDILSLDGYRQQQQKKNDKDTSISMKAVSLGPDFVAIRPYDIEDPRSEKALVRVTKGPYQGLVGSVFSVSSSTALPLTCLTVRRDHMKELTPNSISCPRWSSTVDSKELFLRALRDSEMKDITCNEAEVDCTLNGPCRSDNVAVGTREGATNVVSPSLQVRDELSAKVNDYNFAFSLAVNELSGHVATSQSRR